MGFTVTITRFTQEETLKAQQDIIFARIEELLKSQKRPCDTKHQETQTIQTSVDQESIDLSFPQKSEPSTNQYQKGVFMKETMEIDLE
jgi:hypothetical protein